jgi:hypothetical protein
MWITVSPGVLGQRSVAELERRMNIATPAQIETS